VHIYVLLQHRYLPDPSGKMESLSAGGPGWQVLIKVSGRQAGGGSSTLAGQKIDE